MIVPIASALLRGVASMGRLAVKGGAKAAKVGARAGSQTASAAVRSGRKGMQMASRVVKKVSKIRVKGSKMLSNAKTVRQGVSGLQKSQKTMARGGKVSQPSKSRPKGKSGRGELQKVETAVIRKARNSFRQIQADAEKTFRTNPLEITGQVEMLQAKDLNLKAPPGKSGKWSDLKTVKLTKQDLSKVAGILRAAIIREALKEYAKRGMNPKELEGMIEFKTHQDGVLIIFMDEKKARFDSGDVEDGATVEAAVEGAKVTGTTWVHPAALRHSFIEKGFKVAKKDINNLLIFRAKQALRSRSIV